MSIKVHGERKKLFYGVLASPNKRKHGDSVEDLENSCTFKTVVCLQFCQLFVYIYQINSIFR